MISTPENKPPDEVISWTRPKLKKFRLAFAESYAKDGPKGVFTFEGHEFLVGYAAYLIQYLDAKFKQ